MRLRFSAKCVAQINELSDYIVAELEMPETAVKFIERMQDFSYRLLETHNAYKTCKFPNWAIKGYKCATFEKKWMFAFLISENDLIIQEIKFGALLAY